MSLYTPPRDQDAYPTIRGFVQQVERTLSMWIELQEDECLELERGEDIDRILRRPDRLREASAGDLEAARELVQVKHLNRRITLRTPDVVRAIYDFTTHLERNPGRRIRFVFATTAEVSAERPRLLQETPVDDALRSVAGIMLWRQAAQDSWNIGTTRRILHAIQKCLREAPRPTRVSKQQWTAFKRYLTNGQQPAFLALIKQFAFSTGELEQEALRTSIERRLVEGGLATDRSVASLYEKLFMHVFRLLSQSGSKSLERQDLAAVAAGTTLSPDDRAVFESMHDYLNQETQTRLEHLRRLRRGGRYGEVQQELDLLLQPARWTLLTSTTRVQILQQAGFLELHLWNNVERARRYADQIRDEDGDDLVLRAYIQAEEGEVDAALTQLAGRDDPQSVHAYAFILFINHRDGAQELLKSLQDRGDGNAETLRQLALLALRRGEVSAAHALIQEAIQRDDADEAVRLTLALVQYWSAVSPAVHQHHSFLSPIPLHPDLMRADDASQEALVAAAETFAEAAQATDMAPARRREMQVWQLACLANLREGQAQANDLARALLTDSPEDVVAAMWCITCGLEVDLEPSRHALELLRQEGQASPADIEALAALYQHAGESGAALSLMQQSETLFQSGGEHVAWEQILTAHSGAGTVVSTLAVFEATVLRQDAAGAQVLVAELLKDNQWTAVANHADWLVREIQTMSALRYGAYACVNAAQYTSAQALLDEFMHLCPDGQLPDDLQHLLSVSLVATGDLNRAAQLSAAVALGTLSSAQLELYIRVLYAQGDLLGLANLARTVLARSDAATLLQLARVLRRSHRDVARQCWRRSVELGLPDDLLADALVIASNLGLDEETRALVNRLEILPPDNDIGVRMGSSMHELETLLLGLRQQDAQREQASNDAYRGGTKPIHFLTNERHLVLQYQAAANSSEQTTDGQIPPFNVLGRHASRIRPAPFLRQESGRLFMDATAFLSAAHFDLLDRVEAMFAPVLVTPFLMGTLMGALDQLDSQQPAQIDVARRVMQSVTGGELQIVPNTFTVEEEMEAQLNGGWGLLAPFSRASAALVVDDITQRLHDRNLESEHVDINIQDVLHPEAVLRALRENGVISEQRYQTAHVRIWSAFERDERQLNPGQVLVLSDEALSILAQENILTEAARHFTLYAPSQAIEVFEQILRQVEQTTEVVVWVDDLRERLHRGLREGRYQYVILPDSWRQDQRGALFNDLAILIHQTYGSGDAVWVEDRWVSGSPQMGHALTVTLFDMLDELETRDELTAAERTEMVYRMRRAGYAFVPTEAHELLRLLDAASIRNGALTETAELRAWRQTTEVLASFAPHLQGPDRAGPLAVGPAQRENNLLLVTRQSIIHAFHEVWQRGDGIETLARAEWLSKLFPFSTTALMQAAGPHTTLTLVDAQLMDLALIIVQATVLLQPLPVRRGAFAIWIEGYIQTEHVNAQQLAQYVQQDLYNRAQTDPALRSAEARQAWWNATVAELCASIQQYITT